MKLYSVQGNSQKLDGGSMFGNCPRAVWEKWIPADDLGRIPLSCRCLLVQHDRQNILFETGIGNFFPPKLAHRYGVQSPEAPMLVHNLEKLGFKEDDIDFVVLSHLHFDHAGGLLSSFDSDSTYLRFPKATYIVGRTAWERAENPHFRDRASFIPELTELLKSSGRLKILNHPETDELWNGKIKFFESHGHTPGQVHSLIEGSSGRRIAFAGDLVPGTAWVHLPITMGYDRYPELLIDEKRKLYEQILSPGDWIFYTHDNQVAVSEVTQEQKKFKPHNSHSELLATQF